MSDQAPSSQHGEDDAQTVPELVSWVKHNNFALQLPPERLAFFAGDGGDEPRALRR